ncbi:F0-ATPase delta subunit [Schizosaccharomyces japonicus yFS275]|uniref:ATP synthase subunit 5, mitochondrial n=1 Tax=Schizosaccharomyces japonicus (strain yFS275 / FY16936) TaxID=402676 RepID=B6JXJ1_SCHJY|nr:F0-ATPase delta subunit [Schizosaccharomyces japonicus yFS275]EEB05135.1 F0-ATPase delta subunit [Schizosaccharomyces japonicus yFS275]
MNVAFNRAIARPSAKLFGRVGLRGYAVATKDSVELPIRLYGLDGNYAVALFTAAQKTSNLKEVDSSFRQLEKVMKHAELREFLANPALRKEDKSLFVKEMTKLCGDNKVFSNFLQVLSDNNRLSLLQKIYLKFHELMKAKNNEVTVTVTTATPLDEQSMLRLQRALSKSSFVKGKLVMNNKVTPSILGGIVLEIGDMIVDASIQSKVTKLNQALNESI